MKRKVLVTGSAPYLPTWWEKNSDKLDGYDVWSINTSILVTKDRCDHWKRSEDFYFHHADLEAFRSYEDKFFPKSNGESYPPVDPNVDTTAFTWPFICWRPYKQQTTLTETLLELLNHAFWYEDMDEVSVIGCDLIYKNGEQNHFYKGGTNDPMRLGENCLRTNLDMFRRAYKRVGIQLYNLSESDETMLPFDRKTL